MQASNVSLDSPEKTSLVDSAKTTSLATPSNNTIKPAHSSNAVVTGQPAELQLAQITPKQSRAATALGVDDTFRTDNIASSSSPLPGPQNTEASRLAKEIKAIRKAVGEFYCIRSPVPVKGIKLEDLQPVIAAQDTSTFFQGKSPNNTALDKYDSAQNLFSIANAYFDDLKNKNSHEYRNALIGKIDAAISRNCEALNAMGRCKKSRDLLGKVGHLRTNVLQLLCMRTLSATGGAQNHPVNKYRQAKNFADIKEKLSEEQRMLAYQACVALQNQYLSAVPQLWEAFTSAYTYLRVRDGVADSENRTSDLIKDSRTDFKPGASFEKTETGKKQQGSLLEALLKCFTGLQSWEMTRHQNPETWSKPSDVATQRQADTFSQYIVGAAQTELNVVEKDDNNPSVNFVKQLHEMRKFTFNQVIALMIFIDGEVDDGTVPLNPSEVDAASRQYAKQITDNFRIASQACDAMTAEYARLLESAGDTEESDCVLSELAYRKIFADMCGDICEGYQRSLPDAAVKAEEPDQEENEWKEWIEAFLTTTPVTPKKNKKKNRAAQPDSKPAPPQSSAHASTPVGTAPPLPIIADPDKLLAQWNSACSKFEAGKALMMRVHDQPSDLHIEHCLADAARTLRQACREMREFFNTVKPYANSGQELPPGFPTFGKVDQEFRKLCRESKAADSLYNDPLHKLKARWPTHHSIQELGSKKQFTFRLPESYLAELTREDTATNSTRPDNIIELEMNLKPVENRSVCPWIVHFHLDPSVPVDRNDPSFLRELTSDDVLAVHVKPGAFRFRGKDWVKRTQEAYARIGRTDINVTVPRREVGVEQALAWLRQGLKNSGVTR